MNIRQAALGAGLAVLLVFGADSDRSGAQAATALHASAVQPACDIAGIKETVRDAAQAAGTVVLDVVFDAAGELLACAKQVF
ncbi:hypothetical protein [Rhizomicrobium electricum]|uniref:Uncharacterized protein n=1 Tax=Rhizomicrobium electricum TaxID=480070 RepID=A0ABP3Q953_9PROT|nr:hypothetical protein [Rhizomicrobium electricum]NIJ46740.1 hypothetical protein [Rhizomicrobium electricum]